MADGGSRYRFTEGCSLKIDAGQDSTIAPSRAFLTALAFLSSGTKQLMCCALIIVGMVRVIAVLGTKSILSNQVRAYPLYARGALLDGWQETSVLGGDK